MPLRQAESIVEHFMVRTAVDPLLVAPTVAAAVASFDNALSVGGVTTMNAIVRRARGPWQFTMLVFSMFGGVAIALAAVGLFALAATRLRSGREKSDCEWRWARDAEASCA